MNPLSRILLKTEHNIALVRLIVEYNTYDFIRIGENIEDFEVTTELGILELRREVGINVDMENEWLE